MEGGVRPDRGCVETAAALGHDGVEVGGSGEVAVGNRPVQLWSNTNFG